MAKVAETTEVVKKKKGPKNGHVMRSVITKSALAKIRGVQYTVERHPCIKDDHGNIKIIYHVLPEKGEF